MKSMHETKSMTMKEINEARKRLHVPNCVPSATIVHAVAGTGVHQRIKMKLAFDRLVTTVFGDIEPVDFPQANGKLTGNADTKDLPVCRTDNIVVSCWHVSFWKRFKILVTGKLWLVVKGKTQPPLWIDTEVFWK